MLVVARGRPLAESAVRSAEWPNGARRSCASSGAPAVEIDEGRLAVVVACPAALPAGYL